ncbi:MAG: hypothetical protein B6I28_04145 [Fusobacteriia bacterium 4572_132]|nr:MAG: hypothetical protein B6I28_04145 [Fusobacteriia bacterium 4572_132]
MKKKSRILIVDDVKTAHLMYKKALESEKYDIFDAERGKEALSLFYTEELDLIVLDINLPDITGIEVLKKIREKNKEIPVIILTAYGMKERVMKAAKYGISYYLVKPVDLNLFRKRISETLKEEKESEISKLANKSEKLLEDLIKVEIDDDLKENVKKLKYEIKGLAQKLIVIERNKKQKNVMEKIIWKKDVICPACLTTFTTYNYKSKSLPIIKKEADFHEIYDVISPLMFDIWVCPECLYAAKRENFIKIEREELEKIAKDKIKRKKMVKDKDFRKKRDYELGILSYRLAVTCYKHRKFTNGFFGSIYLKAAWLARENEMIEEEKEFLESVIYYYEKALSNGEKIGGQLTELGLIYLLGEIYRRIGKLDKAAKYFMRVKSDENIIKEKAIMRMADEQLEIVKEEKKLRNENSSKRG